MRHLPPEETERAARLAIRYRDQGVVGFDLAGAERGHPPAQHAGALRLVRDAGLGITLHAGEADVAERVLEAGRLGAQRIVQQSIHLWYATQRCAQIELHQFLDRAREDGEVVAALATNGHERSGHIELLST